MTVVPSSVLTEGVWDNRYRYVDEFRRMGAQIQVDGPGDGRFAEQNDVPYLFRFPLTARQTKRRHTAAFFIEGVDHLTGAPVEACDLRAGAALIIAGLAAQGVTEVGQVQTSLAVMHSRCLGITFLIRSWPPVATTAAM